MVTLNAKDHLILFGRYPLPGRTKTRLIPALGPVGAASLQKRLMERTLDTARMLAAETGVGLTFCHDGGDRQALDAWLDLDGIACVPQSPGDLGRRMLAALTRAFDQGAQRVVLVGTDIPDLSAPLLTSAFQQLRQHQLVIGPSTDGGYWLVGMNRPTDIFERIPWSTPTVLRDTLALTRRRGLSASLLEPLSDLDEPADLDRLGFPASPYLSVIIPTLNEEGHLADTLASARSPDADLIVSDGGSTDRTVACARAGGARIVTGPRGRARQQNRGADAARGRILLFLHADTRLPGNYVNQIFDTLMDRRVALGAFRFRTDLETPAMRWISFWTNLRASLLQMPYGDQGLFLTRSRFEAAGGFPDVPIAEDLYLVKRLAKRGRIALAPACAVTSGRRWRQHGTLRTTLINTIIASGCVAGIDPRRLAPLYRLPAREKRT